jgi:tripartite-type tricarboxylate transporter receptor subunit TctC
MNFCKWVLAIVAATGLASAVSAQTVNYPNKPVKVVVGYAAGGAVDVVARTIGQSLQTSLGQALSLIHI